MALQRLSHSGNAPPTNLLSPISASSLSFNIANGAGYPTGATAPFVLDIDPGTSSEEKVLCQSLAGTTVTVVPGGRGWDGTTATAHSPAPNNVTHVCSSAELDDANAHIYVPSRDDHTQYARADGGRAGAVLAYIGGSPPLLVTGITTPVPFNTVISDTWSAWNASTFTFTAPTSGLYRVYAQLYTSMPVSALQLGQLVNGSFDCAGLPGSPNIDSFAGGISVMWATTQRTHGLTAGMTLQVAALLTAVSTASWGADGARSFLEISQVH